MIRSYYESSARARIAGLLDADSFYEWLPAADRVTSPHLAILEQPAAFDDGVVIGQGSIAGKNIFIAAQEGGFMGGAVGEVHGAKIVGVLERAVRDHPAAVLLLLETGGVRLQEANAGLIAVSEVRPRSCQRVPQACRSSSRSAGSTGVSAAWASPRVAPAPSS